MLRMQLCAENYVIFEFVWFFSFFLWLLLLYRDAEKQLFGGSCPMLVYSSLPSCW